MLLLLQQAKELRKTMYICTSKGTNHRELWCNKIVSGRPDHWDKVLIDQSLDWQKETWCIYSLSFAIFPFFYLPSISSRFMRHIFINLENLKEMIQLNCWIKRIVVHIWCYTFFSILPFNKAKVQWLAICLMSNEAPNYTACNISVLGARQWKTKSNCSDRSMEVLLPNPH